MSIISATTDTDNPDDDFEEQPGVVHDFDGVFETAIDHLRRMGCAQFDETLIFSYQDLSDDEGPAVFVAIDGAQDTEPFFVWLDETHTGVLVHVRRIMPEPEFTDVEVPPVYQAPRTPTSEKDRKGIRHMLHNRPDFLEPIEAILAAEDVLVAKREDYVQQCLARIPSESDHYVARMVIDAHLDEDPAEIVKPYIPTFPCPKAKRVPNWADEVGAGRWDRDDQAWVRTLSSTSSLPDGSGVEISARHTAFADGRAEVDGLDFYVSAKEVASPEHARQLGHLLIQAADRAVGVDPINTPASPTALAVANIGAILSVTELEVETLRRLAEVLGVKASDLLRPKTVEGD